MFLSLRRGIYFFPHLVLLSSILVLIIAPSHSQAQILGDLTHDGSVSLADATRLWGIVRGLQSATADDTLRGDVFPRPGTEGRTVGDGLLDSLDVDRMLDFLVGNLSDASFYGTPSVEEIRPSYGSPGDTLSFFSVFGQGFLGASSISFDPADSIAVDTVAVFSDTFLQARVRLSSLVAQGIRNVHAVSPGGTSSSGPGNEFTVYPSGGQPASLVCIPPSLTLTAGSGPGFISLTRAPADSGVSSVTASSGNSSVATVASSTEIPSGVADAVIEVIPEAVGTTTISGSWIGISFEVAVEVVPPEFSALPGSFYLFQTGLLDTMVLFLSPQHETRTILLQSSNPSIVSVTSTVTFPANQFFVSVQVVPGFAYGDAAIRATLPSDLGGEAVDVAVHVEQLRITISSSESPLTLQDNSVLDDPKTPEPGGAPCDEGFAIGTGGILISLNGASRVPQPVVFEAFPQYVPGGNPCRDGIDGFAVMSSVVIPPTEVFWAAHVGGIIEGQASPPVSGIVRATLEINPDPVWSSVPAQMSWGPPVRQAVRFSDSEVGMVPGQAPRRIIATVDQANSLVGGPIPNWTWSVSGDAVTVTRDTLDVERSRASLFLVVTPLRAGSSVIRATCLPEGLTDSVRVNVLDLEVVDETRSGLRGMAPRGAAQGKGPLVIETDGMKMVNDPGIRYTVQLPGVEGAQGYLTAWVIRDHFFQFPSGGGPDIAAGSSMGGIVAEDGENITRFGLQNGQPIANDWWNGRDGIGEIVKPGRYRILARVSPQPRDRTRPVFIPPETEEMVKPSPIVNVAQVVYLKFNDDFKKDLDELHIGDRLEAIKGLVKTDIQREFRDPDSVNVVTSLVRPFGFEFKTLEIGGTDPQKHGAMGASLPSLGNPKPGRQIARANGEGVFTAEFYRYYYRMPPVGQTGGDAGFWWTFYTDTYFYDKNVAAAIYANMVVGTAVHELSHDLGLVAGSTIASFDPSALSGGPVRYTSWHNNEGEFSSAGFYMNAGVTFRELAMIKAGANWPWATGDFGKQYRLKFVTDPCLKYLRRLLPRGETVR